MSKLLFVPDPKNIGFELWANRCSEDLNGQVWFPRPDERKWRDWASQLFFSGDLVAEGIPDPKQYNNWRDWALQWMVTQN